MKKYIILLSLFILFFVGVFAVTRALEDQYGVEGSSASSSFGNPKGENSGNSVLESMQGRGNAKELSEEGTFIDNPEGTILNQSPETITAKLTAQDWQARKDAGLTNSNIALAMSQCVGLYAYDTLSAEEKQLYAEVLLVYRNLEGEVPLCSNDVAAVEKVSSCVLLDHPEIFYTDGYSFEQYMFLGNVQKITYSPTYILTKEEINSRIPMIEEAAAAFMKELPPGATEYDKVKYVYEVVILNTEYNLDAPDNQNICSVFLGRESVCLGYAKAVQYLLQKAGVQSVVVTGSVISGEPHAWNLVKVNGQYYYLDATWGDASYMLDSGMGDSLSTINFDYLNITTADLLNTHIINNPIDLPNCVAQMDNYHVKEGLYINSVESMTVQKIFENARDRGMDSVSIRCSNKIVFDEFNKDMLENQKIFHCLGGSATSLAYSVNDKLYTYTFML